MNINRKKLGLGLLGLAGFAVVFVLLVSPVFGDRNGLQWADSLFNRLSKESAYFVPKLRPQAAQFEGTPFGAEVAARSDHEAGQVAALFTAAGCRASIDGTKVRIDGDLGAAAKALMADAEDMHYGRLDRLRTRYGFDGKEAIYGWWVAFDAIFDDYVTHRQVAASDFAIAMRTKVCEPAYNFCGIEPLRCSQAALPLAALLLFYLVYTVWYGFSIMSLFEGAGIGPHAGRKREG